MSNITPSPNVPSVNFPDTLSPFRFFCQKTLPAVYDDSLSYYELLCKVVALINDTLANVNMLNDDVKSIYEFANNLKEWVDGYFDSLDVQNEINNKLDGLVEDGTFESLINEKLFGEINAKIAKNSGDIEGLNNTLTEKISKNEANSVDMAMLTEDVKKAITGGSTAIVGDDSVYTGAIVNGAVTEDKLSENLQKIFKYSCKLIDVNWVSGSYINYSGEVVYSGNIIYNYAILPVTTGQIYYMTIQSINNVCAYCLMNNNTLVEVVPASSTNERVFYTIEIPEGVNQIRINNFTPSDGTRRDGGMLMKKQTPAYFYPEGIQIAQLDQALRNSFTPSWEDVSLNWTDNAYIPNENNSLFGALTLEGYGYAYVDVKPGELYRLVCGSIYGASAYALGYRDSHIEWSNIDKPSTLRTFDVEIYVPNDCFVILIQYSPSMNKSATHVYKPASYTVNGTFIDFKPLKDLKWLVMGDSITEKNMTASINYVDLVSSSTGLIPTNIGISGSGYGKRENDNVAFYQRANQNSEYYDVVSIMGSFNDMSSGKELGNLTDSTTETLAGCMNTTMKTLIDKNPKTQVVVFSPTPWSGYHPGAEKSDSYVDMIEQVSEKWGMMYVDVYKGCNLRPWIAECNEALFYNNDGTHPNNEGHQRIAPLIAESLIKAVREYKVTV